MGEQQGRRNKLRRTCAEKLPPSSISSSSSNSAENPRLPAAIMVPVTLNQRGERVYRPYHQKQVQSRCGLHAINNAIGSPSKCCMNFTFTRGPADLGQPASVTVDMAATAAQRLRAEEASFLGVNANTVRPFMQPGEASSSPFVFQSPPRLTH